MLAVCEMLFWWYYDIAGMMVKTVYSPTHSLMKGHHKGVPSCLRPTIHCAELLPSFVPETYHGGFKSETLPHYVSRFVSTMHVKFIYAVSV